LRILRGFSLNNPINPVNPVSIAREDL